MDMVLGERMDGLMEGAVQAVEEAIVNALCAAETTVGRHGRVAHALPHGRLRAVLAQHNALRGAGARKEGPVIPPLL